MQNMNNVVYRDLDESQALTSTIDKKLKKLNRISTQIHSSRVVLDSPHQHKNKGKMFRAQIELGVKGNSFTLHQDDPSIHVAVRDLFKAAERKLKEVSAKQAATKETIRTAPLERTPLLEEEMEYQGNDLH